MTVPYYSTGLSAKVISYSYYPDGSRDTMTTPAGDFTYSYDDAGRLVSLTNPSSQVTSWQYLDNDWLARQDYDNDAYTLFTQNALGQLSRLRNYTASGATLLSDYTDLTHDGAGNLLNLDAYIPAHSAYTGTTTYEYDTKDQLTAEETDRYTGYTYEFAYDDAGNPTTFKGGTTRTYNENNQLTGTGYAYDDNGNPTLYRGSTLAYDPENHLTAYGSVFEAGYRGDGLRAWKEVPEGEGTTRTYFLYDGMQLIHEMDEDGDIIATNTWGVNGLAIRNDSRGNTYYMFDPLGNAAHRLDEDGDVQSNDLYDAYGAMVDGGDTADPYGYNAQSGYYTDHETGLMLCTFRYYDPETGRWLTRDPISYDGGINLYGYCVNNPIAFDDVLGLQRKRWIYIPNGPDASRPYWLSPSGGWGSTGSCAVKSPCVGYKWNEGPDNNKNVKTPYNPLGPYQPPLNGFGGRPVTDPQDIGSGIKTRETAYRGAKDTISPSDANNVGKWNRRKGKGGTENNGKNKPPTPKSKPPTPKTPSVGAGAAGWFIKNGITGFKPYVN